LKLELNRSGWWRAGSASLVANRGSRYTAEPFGLDARVGLHRGWDVNRILLAGAGAVFTALTARRGLGESVRHPQWALLALLGALAGGVRDVRIRIAVMLLLVASLAHAAEGAPARAGGVELDLLPPVMSAVAGGVGLSGQAWGGQDRWRARVVGARILFPDALGPPKPFGEQRLAVVAVIVDRFFEDDFRGPWVGAGAEYWWSSVGHDATAARASWESPVMTAGAGWVCKVWHGLYLNPWGAAHWSARDATPTLAGDRWAPRRFSAEASLKVGWSFGG
jgi:hypothetical protein